LSTPHTVTGTFFSNSQIEIPGCTFEQADIRDPASITSVCKKVRPRLIIQVCGTKSIEFCEAYPGEAKKIHTEGTQHVVEACLSLNTGTRLAYISTDCVFNGKKQSYTEEDQTDPFNYYGHVKRDSEEIIINSGLNFIVIRTSLLFGWRRCNRQACNFVISVYKALNSGEVFSAAANIFNTPLEISHAARAVAALALGRDEGIFHVAGNTRISRYDFAIKSAEILRLDPSYLRQAIDNSGLRQLNSCLSVKKTESSLNIRFEKVEEGLKRMAAQSPSNEV